MIEFFKRIPRVLRDAYVLLKQNDPLILAAATAFFTTFSLCPIIVIIVSVLNLYFQSDVIRLQLFNTLQDTFGKQTSKDIETIVNNFMALESGGWFTLVGSIFLLFVATTLLSIVRKAIHQLWHLRKKTTVRLKYGLKERGIGLVMLVFIGALFLFSLLIDTSLTIFYNYLHGFIHGVDTTLIWLINVVFSILVVTTWFTILFKFLPEARVHWKVAFAGGLVTGLLFNTGKFVLGLLLVESNLETIFGASASIALLLLFIFYSSMIMYYGAAFTHAFGQTFDKPILPGKYSNEYEEHVLEDED
jgi:membrane protein